MRYRDVGLVVETRSQSVCLAVLPFENLSSEQGRDYFARGFVEDLITELSRFPTLEVIASRSSEAIASQDAPERAARELDIDYLLRGSFRYGDDRLRINTRLVDPQRNSVLWAERYDSPVDDVFDIQDAITSQVVGALSTLIEVSRLAHARRKPVSELAAYDCWLRGMEHLRRGTLADDEEARKFFRQALELEPQNARAYAGLSLSYFNEWSCQLWGRWEENQVKAFDYALRAIELDEADHVIQLVLGRICLFRRDFDRAESHFHRAYELNPNDADNLIQLCNCWAFLGDPRLGVELMDKALRLNPYRDSWYYAYGAWPYFMLRDYDRALEMLSRAPPELMVDLPAFKGAACAYLGDVDAAARHIQDFREAFIEKITLGQPVSDEEMLNWVVEVNPFRQAEESIHLAEGLRRAGLGERRSAPRASGDGGEARVGSFRLVHGVRHMDYGGRGSQLPEVKGFGDIAALLARPGEEIHCTELFGVCSEAAAADVLDARARTEYRQRIEALQEELEEAEAMNDSGRAAAAREELELIIDHLGKATGLGGRSRKLGATSERARSAVTQRIRNAISRIADANPPLAEHLRESIRTGTFCAYCPDNGIEWQL